MNSIALQHRRSANAVSAAEPHQPLARAGTAPAVAQAPSGDAGDGAQAAEAAQQRDDGEPDEAQLQREQRRQALMARIQEQPDFATMKASMAGIQKISRSDRAHARALSDLIHDDAAMVGKLLRLINAAYYSSVGGGEITSIQRAVSLMGFKSIGLLASSLVLFERLPKGVDGQVLRREFARAQLAALLAHDLCHSRDHIEDIYIAALFQRLGDMLAGLHFRDDAQLFDDLLDDRELSEGSTERHEAREQLAREQWGMGIEEIGIEVARQWGWPPALLLCMRSLKVTDPDSELAGDEYVRVLCTTANALAEELIRLPEEGKAEERAEARAAFVLRYAADLAVPLGLNLERLPDVVEGARANWEALMQTLGVELSAAKAAAETAAPRLDPSSLQYRQLLAENLADAVDHLARMNQRGAGLIEVVDAALKRMAQSLDLQRAVMLLRDPESEVLQGWRGLGDRHAVLTPQFRVPMAPPSDLFGLLCMKGVDTHITDTSDPVIAQRLPEWFHKKVRAGGFIVLPLVKDGAALGMLYGDQRDAGGMKFNERALTLLKNLRNQVLQALSTDPR